MQGNPRQKQKGLYCSRECAAQTRGEMKSANHAIRVAWEDIGGWFHSWGQQEILTSGIAFERILFPSSKRLHRIKLLPVKREKAKRKSGKLRSRCKLFGVPYDSRVGRLSVCNRDGWICAICGVKTIKTANRHHPHPLEGTIDHIIPLSKRTKGNTWDNAQCACRRCNCQKKRARLMCCQMRLF
jgi:5-methylcytosine-specific restriction endonuclease McrA